MLKITKEEFIKIFNAAPSVLQAAKNLNMSYGSCKKLAKKFCVFQTNPGGKGISKPSKIKIPLEDILSNKVPYQTFKLKNRLYREGFKQNKCEICGINEWNGKTIQCQLDHIDGDCYNNNLENLRIICPNCYSQTDTFCSKNRKKLVPVVGLEPTSFLSVTF